MLMLMQSDPPISGAFISLIRFFSFAKRRSLDAPCRKRVFISSSVIVVLLAIMPAIFSSSFSILLSISLILLKLFSWLVRTLHVMPWKRKVECGHAYLSSPARKMTVAMESMLPMLYTMSFVGKDFKKL